MPDPVCDFCSDPKLVVVWTYPADDFPDPDGDPWNSTGPWAACAKCSGLIEAGDYAGLAHWTALTFVSRHGTLRGPVAVVEKGFRRLHQAFRAHRTGPRQAVLGMVDGMYRVEATK